MTDNALLPESFDVGYLL